MLSRNHLNSTNRYVALDVETTGLSPKNGDRVIEIGAVAIENQGIIAEFSSLIDVDKMIPWQVQKVHGITNEMLYGEPKPDEVLPEFYEFIAGSILVAHNASFDIRTRLPNHKLATVSRYLLGESANQMQKHRQIKQIKDRIEEIKAEL